MSSKTNKDKNSPIIPTGDITRGMRWSSATKAIEQGLEAMKRGEGTPAEEFFAEFFVKNGIPKRTKRKG